MTAFRKFVAVLFGSCVFAGVGCDDGPKTPPKAEPAADHDHDHDHAGHDHAAGAGHHEAMITLGSGTAGGFTVEAKRGAGLIDPGGDVPIDAKVTPAADTTAKPTAVRFWIGTEDGAGSAKAKAELESPSDPTLWHTHAEVPSPLPAGAKLWVEVEADGGAKAATGFELKR